VSEVHRTPDAAAMAASPKREPKHEPGPTPRGALFEVGWLFFVLGCTAFGGPAAHIALMREECVKRREWISEERFLDLFGAVNLIPGPSSTQLALYLGYLRAGWRGLALAGMCFITPATAIVMALAWGYVTYGSLPQVGWLLYGIKPVVIAVIAQAIYGLGRTALRGVLPVACFVALVALYFLGANVLVLLACGALAFAVLRVGIARASLPRNAASMVVAATGSARRFAAAKLATLALTTALTVAAPITLLALFLVFLKLGAVAYGSGYTLLAFIREDFVNGLRWLSERQVLDAITIGQVTPGPVFTTATFIGYLVFGWQGALAATVGIFLPSFAFVPFIHLVATRLRASRWATAFLSGANVAALALMVGVSLTLAGGALIDPYSWALALLSLLLLIQFKANPMWLIVLGAGASIGGHLLNL
jgi:chromate transporter